MATAASPAIQPTEEVDRVKKFKFLATLAVVGAIASALGGSALAAPAIASSWTRLGGDPLVPGGVNTRADFVRVMTSDKGATAMTYAGLNQAERKAVVMATRTGNFQSCTMRYGERFWRMSFGIRGTSVDRNVRFQDSRYMGGAPSWCVTAVVGGKGGYMVTIKMPRICGNVAVPKQPTRKVSKPTKPSKPVKTVKVKKTKQIKKTVQKKINPRTVICTERGTEPQFVGGQWNCVAQTISQTNNNKTDQSGTTQGQGSPVINNNVTVQVNQAQQTAVNQNQGQVTTPCCAAPPPPPPPPPANRPPQVAIENPPAHVCVNGQFVFRANFSDPDGDNLQVSWTTSNGTVSSGRERVTYTAPGAQGTGSVTVTVSDGTNPPVSATASFRIPPESAGECNF